MTELHAVMVTYRRPTELEATLAAIALQSRPPDSIVVVDNDNDEAVREIVERVPTCHYIASTENLGPAGGLALGFEAVVASAGDADWVVFLDDDDPPPDHGALERLLELAERADASDRVGAVGMAGAHYRRRTGALTRPTDRELNGLVKVDYIGGNQLPMYSVAALTQAGGPAPALFFGFDDLELGLRLQDAGYTLLVDGHEWLRRRGMTQRLDLTPRQASASRRQSTWRRYYAVRNQVWIARQFGSPLAPFIVTIRSGLGSAARELVVRRSPRSAWSALAGVAHAWMGRLGRTITP